jgi:hypothetical protein
MKQSIFAFPVSMADFFGFQRNAYQIILPNAVAWGVPAEQLAKFTLRHDTFESDYLITDNDGWQNPIYTRARNDSAALLKETLSEIYEKNIVYNDTVDVATKGALHIHDMEGNSGVQIPTPRTAPVVSLEVKEISSLRVVFSDLLTPLSHAKPDGVAFCELAYKIDAPAPETVKDCTDRFLVSRSNSSLVFEPEQRAKKIYGFARWVNKNSKVGPWSGIVSAIIP